MIAWYVILPVWIGSLFALRIYATDRERRRCSSAVRLRTEKAEPIVQRIGQIIRLDIAWGFDPSREFPKLPHESSDAPYR